MLQRSASCGVLGLGITVVLADADWIDSLNIRPPDSSWEANPGPGWLLVCSSRKWLSLAWREFNGVISEH